jgi:hypothetical protein
VNYDTPNDGRRRARSWPGGSRDAAHVARAIASAAARLDITRLGIAAIWHGLMKFLRLWRMTRTNQ